MDPLVQRVAARFTTSKDELLSREFPTDEALKKYLQDHPKADKSKHTVKPTKEQKDEARSKERDREDAEFSQALRKTLKDKGVSENAIHTWIDKEKAKLDETAPGDYGKKEKAEQAEREFGNDLRKMLRDKGISTDDAKKWVEEEKKKLAMVQRVATKFHSPHELQEYVKEHPDADKSKLKVMTPAEKHRDYEENKKDAALAERVASFYLAALDRPSNELIIEAMKAGEAAFKAGRKNVPAHDPGLAKILHENQGHPMGWSMPLLKAWGKGWMKANLAAPVDADEG